MTEFVFLHFFSWFERAIVRKLMTLGFCFPKAQAPNRIRTDDGGNFQKRLQTTPFKNHSNDPFTMGARCEDVSFTHCATVGLRRRQGHIEIISCTLQNEKRNGRFDRVRRRRRPTRCAKRPYEVNQRATYAEKQHTGTSDPWR